MTTRDMHQVSSAPMTGKTKARLGVEDDTPIPAVGAMPFRKSPGYTGEPIHLGTAPPTLITNAHFGKWSEDGSMNPERTPGMIVARSEWERACREQPAVAPDESKIQVYMVGGDFRNGMTPNVLRPAAYFGVHTVVVALGRQASNRAIREDVDYMDLDWENEKEVLWSVVVVPVEWFEQVSGRQGVRDEYYRNQEWKA